MRGAEALVGSLTAAGVDVCFMNPGTSEMHFVQALDAVPEMRGVLALFEGVATGAADAYARIAGKPAAVLLHKWAAKADPVIANYGTSCNPSTNQWRKPQSG